MQNLAISDLKSLRNRVESIQTQSEEQILTLIEILANANFFGQQRKDNCEYLKNDLCTYYAIPNDNARKLPIMIECKIANCKSSPHLHIRATDIGCCLCKKEKLTISKARKNEETPKVL